jgi:hypothetical protein
LGLQKLFGSAGFPAAFIDANAVTGKAAALFHAAHKVAFDQGMSFWAVRPALFRVSPFCQHVLRIFGVASRGKMEGLYAKTIVALVAHKKSCRYFSLV